MISQTSSDGDIMKQWLDGFLRVVLYAATLEEAHYIPDVALGYATLRKS